MLFFVSECPFLEAEAAAAAALAAETFFDLEDCEVCGCAVKVAALDEFEQ